MTEDFQVWRGGATSAYHKPEPNAGATIQPSRIGGLNPGVTLTFNIASKGGGYTSLSVHVPPEKFDKLRAAMACAEEMRAILDSNHFGRMVTMEERLSDWWKEKP